MKMIKKENKHLRFVESIHKSGKTFIQENLQKEDVCYI